MKRLRLLNPFRISRVVQRAREVRRGGGPVAVRLAGVSHPEGWIVPTARICLEVLARDGRVTRFEPVLPVPFPYAWAYRVARRLGVPLVSSVDPGRLRTEIPVPRR